MLFLCGWWLKLFINSFRPDIPRSDLPVKPPHWLWRSEWQLITQKVKVWSVKTSSFSVESFVSETFFGHILGHSASCPVAPSASSALSLLYVFMNEISCIPLLLFVIYSPPLIVHIWGTLSKKNPCCCSLFREFPRERSGLSFGSWVCLFLRIVSLLISLISWCRQFANQTASLLCSYIRCFTVFIRVTLKQEGVN